MKIKIPVVCKIDPKKRWTLALGRPEGASFFLLLAVSAARGMSSFNEKTQARIKVWSRPGRPRGVHRIKKYLPLSTFLADPGRSKGPFWAPGGFWRVPQIIIFGTEVLKRPPKRGSAIPSDFMELLLLLGFCILLAHQADPPFGVVCFDALP